MTINSTTDVDKVSKKVNKYEEDEIREERKTMFDDNVSPNIDCD